MSANPSTTTEGGSEQQQPTPAKLPHACAFPDQMKDVIVVDDLSPESQAMKDACNLLKSELEKEQRLIDEWQAAALEIERANKNSNTANDDSQSKLQSLPPAPAVIVPVLGLDMEWTTTHSVVQVENGVDDDGNQKYRDKKVQTSTKVALLQLCSGKYCVLFRLCRYAPLWNAPTPEEAAKLFPAPLLELLSEDLCIRSGKCVSTSSSSNSTTATNAVERKQVIKVGVGIQGDQSKLEKDFGIKVGPVMEAMAAAYHMLPVEKIPTGKSLKELAKSVCGISLTKDLSITLSNWADTDPKKELSSSQIEYASDDARSSYKIVTQILNLGFGELSAPAAQERSQQVREEQQEKTPEEASSAPATNATASLLTPDFFYERHCIPLYSLPPVDPKKKGKMTKEEKEKQKKAQAVARQSRDRKVPNSKAFIGRNKNYYDNIRILDPAGKLLCTADTRKAGWYVNKKGLAFVRKLKDGTELELPPENERLLSQQAAIDAHNESSSSDDEHDDEEGSCMKKRKKKKQNKNQTDGGSKHHDSQAISEGSPNFIPAETMGEIQLKFWPSDERTVNDEYYLAEKKNVCVVCGNSENFVRHFIVPIAYRKHLPMDRVYHNSYDIMLICTVCFPKVTVMVDKEREQIARDYQFPLTIAEQVGAGSPLPVVVKKVATKAKNPVDGEPLEVTFVADDGSGKIAAYEKNFDQYEVSTVFQGKKHVPLSTIAEHRTKIQAIIRYCGVLADYIGVQEKKKKQEEEEEEVEKQEEGADEQEEMISPATPESGGGSGSADVSSPADDSQTTTTGGGGAEANGGDEDGHPKPSKPKRRGWNRNSRNPNFRRGENRKIPTAVPESRIKEMTDFLKVNAANYNYRPVTFTPGCTTAGPKGSKARTEPIPLEEQHVGYLKGENGEVLEVKAAHPSVVADWRVDEEVEEQQKSANKEEEGGNDQKGGPPRFNPEDPLNLEFLTYVAYSRVSDATLRYDGLFPISTTTALTTTTTPGPPKINPDAAREEAAQMQGGDLQLAKLSRSEIQSINYLLQQSHYSYIVQHVMERGMVKDALVRNYQEALKKRQGERRREEEKTTDSVDSSQPTVVTNTNENHHAPVQYPAPVQKLKEEPKIGDKVALENPCLVQEVTEFVIRWRELFVNKMKPKELPTAWDPYDGRSVVSFMTAQADPLDPAKDVKKGDEETAGSEALVGS